MQRLVVGRLVLVGLALGMVGCAPIAGAGGAWMAMLGTLLLVSSVAWAGPPAPKPPCDGWVHESCNNGRIHETCHPKGLRINYAYAPYIKCGYDACVPGNDPAKCTPLAPRIDASRTTQAACEHAWQKACVNNKVTEACIQLPPTNYMGPPVNPRFQTCATPLGERCAVHSQPEACHPTTQALGKKKCDNGWATTKVCVDTHISERCLPEPPTHYDGVYWKATTFTDCGKDRCTAGDKSSCPR